MNFHQTLLLAAATLLTVSCGKPTTALTEQPHPERNTYPVRGIVRAIEPGAHRLSVEHEDVPGFMPSMTMPFDCREAREIAPLHVGDAIQFTLVVTERESWMESVQRIDAKSVKLPAPTPAVAVREKIERLKEGDRLPEFALTDDRSEAISRTTFAGKPLLLTFIFTRCPIPNFCPLMSRNFESIRRGLGSDSPVQYLSISFDPEFDTPERLATYAARVASDRTGWRFASGTPEEITRLTKAFAVYVQPEAGTFSHGLCTALVGADGTIVKLWRGNSWEPAEVVAAVQALPSEPKLAGPAQ